MLPQTLTRFERLLSVVTMVRAGEGASTARLSALVFLLMLASYLLKPVRDALILSESSAEIRSYTVALTATLLILVVPLYGMLFRRYFQREPKFLVLRWVAYFFATTLAVLNDRVHPTINYENPDPSCDLDYVPNTVQDRPVRAALTNSFGFGGHNVSLVVKKYTE